MSGGAFDYKHFMLWDWADIIEKQNPLLATQMRDLAELLNEYDLYICGDTGDERVESAWTKYRDKWIEMDTASIEEMMFERCLETLHGMIKGYRKDD